MAIYTDEYWSERLPENTHPKVRSAIKRIYGSYPKDRMPQGLSDPMYIANVLAYELGIGDGMGSFDL